MFGLYADPHLPSPELLTWAMPLIRRAADIIEARVNETCRDNAPHLTSLIQAARRTAPLRALVRLTYRPLLIDLHERRLEGRLEGVASEDRFESYIRLLQDPEYTTTLWEQHPATRQRCAQLLEDWSANSFQLARRYVDDSDQIAQELGIPANQPISSITADVGDSHRKGQTVAILLYPSGHGVVYKPRGAQTDILLADTFRWLNERGFKPALRSMAVVDRGTHSWARFERNRTPAPGGEATRYYRRYGAILAGLHVLCATDMHRENILDSGEHPLVIDSETIAHTAARLTDFGAAKRDGIGRAAAAATLLGTGALPMPRMIVTDGKVHLVDPSPLGAIGSVFGGAHFADAGTDQMRVVVNGIPPATSPSNDDTNGGPSALTHEDDIIGGFEDAYRLIQFDKTGFLADTRLLQRLAETEIRHLPGDTEMFAKMLWNSQHPHVLEHSSSLTAYFQRLRNHNNTLVQADGITESETQQLLRGDIPVFATTGASRTLIGGDGSIIPEVLEKTGIDMVTERIRRLSDTDLIHQRSIISGTIRSANLRVSDTWPVAPKTLLKKQSGDSWRQSTALAIGQHLLDTATWLRGFPHWISYDLLAEQHWLPRVAGTDLYAGNAGVGVFLAMLEQHTGRRQFGEVADAIAAQCREGALREQPTLGMSGSLDGALYLTAYQARLLGDSRILDEFVKQVAPIYRTLIETDAKNDVISGTAGSLLTLTGILPLLEQPNTVIELITVSASHLTQVSRSVSNNGREWLSGSGAALWGMSHGSSGIALALARAHEINPDAHLKNIVQRTLITEHRAYDPVRHDWPDRRDHPHYLQAWCHGSPGIGLARAALPEHFQSCHTALDAARGLTALRRMSEGSSTPENLSLCHGILGNVTMGDVIAHQSEVTDSWLPARTAMLDRARQIIADEGWVCGSPPGLTPVGLMTGLSGIGAGLLASLNIEDSRRLLTIEISRLCE